MAKRGLSDKNSNDSDTPTRAQQTTANNKARLLEALSKHRGLVYRSCKAAGVNASTYYDYLEKDPAFKEAVDNIIGLEVDRVERGLMKLLKSPDERVQVSAHKIYLDAKGKNRGYGTERKDTHLSGSVNVNATVQDVRFELPNNQTGPDGHSPLPPGWEAATGGCEPG